MSTAAPFRGYTCWSPQNVADTVRGDAANPSDAIFLATHHPSAILRRPLGATSGGVRVTEQEVLDTFVKTETDLLLLPIIGEPGTGKSHLVRWLRARLPRNPTQRLIYVPKDGTSLRRVIELVLDQMEGAEAASLREALNRSADRFNEKEAPTALLDALARTLEFRSALHASDGSGGASDERTWVAESVPTLLRDDVFREHLLRSEGAIQGFVDKALRGWRPGDKGDAFAFSVEDFPINLRGLPRASHAAQEVHSALSSDASLQLLAARMLTEQLGPAVSDVFGLSGASSLSSIMRKTREALARDGKELAILIEDFTVLQGIQRELLDALIAPAVIDGVRVLCPIRAAMAVTSGPFREMEGTITSRAGFSSDVFILDVPYGSAAGWSREAVQSFVGRYLNAARLGQKKIDEAYDHDGHPVPNACEACPHRVACHDGFGASPEGHGLYPFNDAALDRCVRATIGDRFDPRAVLGNVVRFTLNENESAIHHGTFPTAGFDDKYAPGSRNLEQLSIPVRDALGSDPDGLRYARLLTYWGAVPDEIVSLDPAIHDAFSLPARGPAAPPPTGGAPLGPSPESESRLRTRPIAVQQRLDTLERWAASTAELPQGLTNEIRQFLFESVWARVEPNQFFFHPGRREMVRRIFDPYSIRIERSGTRRQSASLLTIELHQDTQTAVVFQGIVLAQHHGHWRFPDGDRAYRLLSNMVEEWATELRAAIRSWIARSGPGKSFVEARIAALVASARILGIPGGESNEAAKALGAAVTPAAGMPAGDQAPGWARLRERAQANRETLREELLAVASVRQGIGGPQALDVELLLPAVRSFLKSWELGPAAPDDSLAERYLRALEGSIQTDLRSERDQLTRSVRRARELLPEGLSARELGDLALRAGETAATAGAFRPSNEIEPFRKDMSALKTMALAPVREAEELVEANWSANLGGALSRLAALDRAKVGRLLEVMTATQSRLQQTDRQLDSRLQGVGGAGEVAQEVATLLDKLAELTGGRDHGA